MDLIDHIDNLEERVRRVLQEHGTALLLPEDEFDCCARVITSLMEEVLTEAQKAQKASSE